MRKKLQRRQTFGQKMKNPFLMSFVDSRAHQCEPPREGETRCGDILRGRKRSQSSQRSCLTPPVSSAAGDTFDLAKDSKAEKLLRSRNLRLRKVVTAMVRVQEENYRIFPKIALPYSVHSLYSINPL